MEVTNLSPDINGLAGEVTNLLAPRRPKYLCVYFDRHGIKRTYFRRGAARMALPDMESVGFAKAYATACKKFGFDPAHEGGEPVAGWGGKNAKANFTRAAERLVKFARTRAYVRKLEIDIDPQWVFDQMAASGFKCVMTGIPFVPPRKGEPKGEPCAPSLDRIDNKRGYTRDNVRVILFSVNVALNTWGHDHLLRISRAIVKNGAIPRAI